VDLKTIGNELGFKRPEKVICVVSPIQITPNNKIAEAKAWVRKYFNAASVEN
jgi:hypothetical protein